MKIFTSLFFLSVFTLFSFGQSVFYEGELLDCSSDSDGYYAFPNFRLDSGSISKIEIVSFETVWLKYGKNHYSPKENSSFKIKKEQLKDRKIKRFNLGKISINSGALLTNKLVSNDSIISELISIIQPKYINDTLGHSGSMLCYNPRDAVIFYNNYGEINAILELCFECNNYSVIAQGGNGIRLCKGSFEKLLKFFTKLNND